MPTQYTCAFCGQSFIPLPFDVRRGMGRFCSRSCSNRARATHNVAGRFWSKVERGPQCWIWQAACSPSGYGKFWVSGHEVRAHRFVWELMHGPIPEGLMVCHHCDTPPCVRPDHLFLGTGSDNMRDMARKRRHPWLVRQQR